MQIKKIIPKNQESNIMINALDILKLDDKGMLKLLDPFF